MRRKPNHLFTLAYARCKSATVALNALRFAVQYGRFCDTIGNDSPRIEEFADHQRMSRANAFRQQAAYRQCFPKQDVLHLWREVIRPNLDASTFKNESPTGQAVFAGTLTIELS